MIRKSKGMTHPDSHHFAQSCFCVWKIFLHFVEIILDLLQNVEYTYPNAPEDATADRGKQNRITQMSNQLIYRATPEGKRSFLDANARWIARLNEESIEKARRYTARHEVMLDAYTLQQTVKGNPAVYAMFADIDGSVEKSADPELDFLGKADFDWFVSNQEEMHAVDCVWIADRDGVRDITAKTAGAIIDYTYKKYESDLQEYGEDVNHINLSDLSAFILKHIDRKKEQDRLDTLRTDYEGDWSTPCSAYPEYN